MTKTILITRPKENAEHDARTLSAQGYNTWIEPLLIVEQTTDTNTKIPDQYEALIFTSANAVRFFENTQKNIPVYTVGTNTEQAAQKAGYTNIINADGTAQDLENKIAKTLKQNTTILLPRGQHTAYPLNQTLTEKGYIIKERILYKTKKVQSFSEKTVEKIKEKDINAITIYSQRSAENLIKLLKKHDLTQSLNQTKLLCISPSVLKYVHSKMPTDVWQGTYSADKPNRTGMFELIKKQIK